MNRLDFCFKCEEPRFENNFSFRNKKEGIRNNTCKVCHTLYLKSHYQNNKKYYDDLAKKWIKNNKSRRVAISSEHASRIRTKNLCKCCSRDELLKYYENRPAGHHIDHIISLRVGGAHCLKNMQYLTASEHGVKSCGERYSYAK